MKEIFKKGASLFLRLIVVSIMCFFVCISMSVLCTAGFTQNIGYDAYGTKEGSEESVHLYTYYNSDGEDTQKSVFEEEGYKVSTSNIRSDISKTGNNVFLIVSQVFSILILISFVYPILWQLGASDSNLVRFKHKNEDKLKGLKIGAVGSIPALAGLICLVVFGLGAKPNFPIVVYKFLNSYYYSFIQGIFGTATTAGQLSVLQYLALLLLILFIPAVGFISYYLGYKDISLSEKFIYKKNNKK